MWIASAGSGHRVASRGMLHLSCQIDVPYSAIATPRLMNRRLCDGGYKVFVAPGDKRVSSLPLTCTVQQVGAFTIACRLLCLRRYAESATKPKLSFRSPMHVNGDGNP